MAGKPIATLGSMHICPMRSQNSTHEFVALYKAK